MFYLNPTKRGIGVELWGSSSDLRIIYQVFTDLWDFDNQDILSENIFSSFLFEIRHADQGDLLKREYNHFSLIKEQYFGCQFSWVQLFFFIAFVNYKKSLYRRNKLLDSIILQLEYWVEYALIEYDKKIGPQIASYLGNSLDGSNPFLYHTMRILNFRFFELRGGKNSFKKLPEILEGGVKGTKDYIEIRNNLLKRAIELGCEINELELDDDNSVYNVRW